MTKPKQTLEPARTESTASFLISAPAPRMTETSRPEQSAEQRRIEHALRLDAAEDLIATALAFSDKLLVIACNGDALSVPWSAIRALRELPGEQRPQFDIETFGSHLHWPGADIHLDLDGLRTAVIPELREAAQVKLRAHNERLGAAMRRLRERAGIRQSGIVGVSERQIRRAENGEVQPRLATYQALANAHRLTLNDYLNAIAEEAACQPQSSP